MPFFVTIELARTTMAPARRTPAWPCLRLRVHSASSGMYSPSTGVCAIRDVNLLRHGHTDPPSTSPLYRKGVGGAAISGKQSSHRACRHPQRRALYPACIQTHDGLNQQMSGCIPPHTTCALFCSLAPGIPPTADSVKPIVIREAPPSRLRAAGRFRCEAQQHFRVDMMLAHQRGCLELPPPCMPASSSPACPPPPRWAPPRQPALSASISLPDVQCRAASQQASSVEDVPLTAADQNGAGGAHGTAGARWHPFSQPAVWEGSEADALQPESLVLGLAPPWRVRTH